MHGSRLYYFNSTTEVKLGDRVKMLRFLRSPRSGVVCYIPGLSPKHRDLEYEDVKKWAIRTEDGTVFGIVYDPETFQPPKSIQFVSRGDATALKPSEGLE